VVALVAVAILIWKFCPPPPPPPPVANDCQQDHLVIHLADHDSVTGAGIPLLGPIADLPEYHDCQRLLVKGGSPDAVSAAAADGLAFGPLVAIWAANKLDSTFILRGGDSSMAVPVAVIYNFDPTRSYAPLGISPGFNCFYLWRDGSWHAAILPLGNDKSAALGCNDARRVDERMRTRSGDLNVVPAGLPDGVSASDIPPVARWDWDATHRQQYIDIRCADEWCQVGPKEFEPAPSAYESGMSLADIMALPDIRDRADGAGTGTITRVFAVKGWYDEQRLDLPGTAPSAAPRLTELTGTAFPHPTLSTAEFANGVWTTVAYLKVPADYEGVVPLRTGISRLQMCKGTGEQCRADPAKTCSAKDQDAADPWWGRTISQAGDTSAVGCVRRRGHGGLALPAAAARWNWNELDAKTWAACQGGCCVLN